MFSSQLGIHYVEFISLVGAAAVFLPAVFGAIINISEFQPNVPRLEFLLTRLWLVYTRSLSTVATVTPVAAVTAAAAADDDDRLTHKAIVMVNFKYM